MSNDIVVKYDGTLITDIIRGEFTSASKSVEKAWFLVPNFGGVNHDTWVARRNQELITIEDSSGNLLWDGYVIDNDNGDPMRITCAGILYAMSWDIANSSIGKGIIDELLVQGAPTDENLKVVTLEEGDPELQNDQYNQTNIPRYAIISDTTKEEVTDVLQSEDAALTNMDPIGGTTHTNTQTQDATFYTVRLNSDSNEGKAVIDFDFEDEAVSEDDQITKIKFVVAASARAVHDLLAFKEDYVFKIYWKYGTASPATIMLRNFTMGTKLLTARTTDIYFEIEIDITEDTQTAYFTKAGGLWSGGIMVFSIDPVGSVDSDTHDAYWDIDYIHVTVYTMSGTFERINRKISDTINQYADPATPYDILQLWNDAEDADYNLLGKGIAEGDNVVVSIGFLEALNRINLRGFEFKINNEVDPNVGVSQDFTGLEHLTIFQTLMESQVYEYFVDRSTGSSIIIGIKEEDITAATITYSTASNPPNEKVSNKMAENNAYGYVVVEYINGTTGKIQADTPGTDPRTKPLDANWIYTEDEALTYGKNWANYYASIHYSIPLTWDYMPTNFPWVGTKYDITLSKWNGSAWVDDSQTDQFCRRVTVQWEAGYTISKAMGWFGGGRTAPDEKQGLWEGEVNRRHKIATGLRGNSRDGTGITRYSQLDGIPSTFAPSAHGNAAHTSTFVDAAGAVAAIAADDTIYTKTEVDAKLAWTDDKQLQIFTNTGTLSIYVILDAVNEYVITNFTIDADIIDVTENIYVEFTHRCTSADATVACQWFAAAQKTDGSEVEAWNIENGTAVNIDSTTANGTYTTTLTISASDIADGDAVRVALLLNEASRSVVIKSARLLYTRKV